MAKEKIDQIRDIPVEVFECVARYSLVIKGARSQDDARQRALQLVKSGKIKPEQDWPGYVVMSKVVK